MNKINLVVTRHPGLLEYLQEIGLATEETLVVSHATPENVAGKNVCGVLPHSLSCLCTSFTEVPLSLPQELRGQELTLDQVRQFAGNLVTYRVQQVVTPAPAPPILEWNNRSGNRGRTAFLVLADGGGKLFNFTGAPIEGVCRSREVSYVRDGKWSYSTYQLAFLPGSRVAWEGHEDFDTSRVGSGEQSWADMAAAWGVEEEELRAFLPTVSPDTAQFLNWET